MNPSRSRMNMMGLRHTPTSIQGLTLLCAALVALPASARPE